MAKCHGKIPNISNLTGGVVHHPHMVDVDYGLRHIRKIHVWDGILWDMFYLKTLIYCFFQTLRSVLLFPTHGAAYHHAASTQTVKNKCEETLLTVPERKKKTPHSQSPLFQPVCWYPQIITRPFEYQLSTQSPFPSPFPPRKHLLGQTAPTGYKSPEMFGSLSRAHLNRT